MTLDELDKICNIALINFYSLGKENQKIQLEQFNPNDDNHMGVFHLATIAQKTLQYKLYLGMNFLQYIKFKWKYHKKFSFKYLWKTKNFVPSCNSFIKNICIVNNCDNAFADIYNQYYKEKNNA